MLKMLNEEDAEQEPWLTAFWKGNFDFAKSRRIFWDIYSGGPQESLILSSCPIDFRRRFLSLLSYQFSTFSPSLALNILQNKNIKQQPQPREYPGSRCSVRLQFKVYVYIYQSSPIHELYGVTCEVPWIALGQLLCFVPIIQKNAYISKQKLRGHFLALKMDRGGFLLWSFFPAFLIENLSNPELEDSWP